LLSESKANMNNFERNAMKIRKSIGQRLFSDWGYSFSLICICLNEEAAFLGNTKGLKSLVFATQQFSEIDCSMSGAG